MILRHVTSKQNLSSILEDGYLKPTSNPGKPDHECVSFEIYNGSVALIKCLLEQKSLKEDEIISLFFDGNMMTEEGLPPVRNVHASAYSKSELQVYIPKVVNHPDVGPMKVGGLLTQDEYDSIGDYRFVQGNVPLKYLTSETKQLLRIDV
ncbi:hypothetical protein P5772_22100 [Bacillus cereus]|uniref:hypothetical protein n=1 Tax=Bacillus TaxID=1386 RepID=UPI001421021B|nr:hypothetical protein [Bacillus cereus]MDF9495168.1 hypothetical protein [Bacillus cereus]NIE93057.1 hypothetical protein [Bacillus sp. Ab-1751]